MNLCPKCGESPITIGQFLGKFDARKTKCRNCGISLKGNRILHVIFYCAVILGLCGAVLIIILDKVYGVPVLSGTLAFLGVLLAVGVPVEIVAWKKGKYLIE
ncbi:MAG: hypothetical protein HN350_07160 [Phycisphaerales bacterium]|jgi:hypothetical protein|nr:hypothetical protein [Phycisphaerales bacterium]